MRLFWLRLAILCLVAITGAELITRCQQFGILWPLLCTVLEFICSAVSGERYRIKFWSIITLLTNFEHSEFTESL